MQYISTAAAMKQVDTNDAAYIKGYTDALKKQHARERERRRRRLYFIKQRAAGVLLIATTLACIPLMDGDATAALLTVPMGLMLIFSREMWIDNQYYREVEERHR
ncbi:MAG: hypothetical protein EOM40_10105 [Clostridia bacterium]|nr:hypothetical protein [Clostridia bacterium]